MTGRLPSSASVAHSSGGEKLHAPAADRNSAVLCALLREHAPTEGYALEIASGTGQHIVAFAQECPGLVWYPTEIDPSRRASIDAYRQEAGVPNIEPAQFLDAVTPGWGKAHKNMSLVLNVNLLHLISSPQAQIVISEALRALAPGGRLIIYGPFKRNGRLISEGDARFHDQLSQADPDIGYKNDIEVERWLKQAGASQIERVEMPANNLAFIATR